MKKFILSLSLICYFSFTHAMNYSTMNYANFFGLPSKASLEEIEQKLADLKKEYSLEKANNVIVYDHYSEYQKFLENIYNTLQQKPMQTPTKEEISKKMNFDFFILLQRQIKYGALNLPQLQLLEKNIIDYIKKNGTTITISKLLTVIEGIIAILQKKPLSADTKKLLLFKSNEFKNVMQESAENKEMCLNTAIKQDFNYSYIDQEFRNTIVRAYLNLIQDLYKTKKSKAMPLLNNLNDLIETQWGSLFPIDPSLVEKLKTFAVHKDRMQNFETALADALTIYGKELHVWSHKKIQAVLDAIKQYQVGKTFEDELTKLKQKVEHRLSEIKNAMKKNNASSNELHEFDKLKQEAKAATTNEQRENKSLEAIEIIDPYKNETPKVLELYNFLIKNYLDANNKSKATEYITKARSKINILSPEEANKLPGFKEEKNQFDTLVKRAKPRPTPPPKPTSLAFVQLTSALQHLKGALTILLTTLTPN